MRCGRARLERLQAVLIDGIGIDAGSIEVTDFLLVGRALGAAGGGFQHGVQNNFGVFGD